MTENPTTLGLAVHGYLTRPLLGPDVSGTIPQETRVETLLAELEHLYTVDLLDDTLRQFVVNAVTTETSPEPAAGISDKYPVGLVLLTTARRFVPHSSAAHDVVAALSAVTSAAISGFAHSGSEAAFACAAVASVRAIADGYKESPGEQGYKQSLDGYKQSPGGYKQ